jgi:plasmid stabilization system protein ParE
MRIVWSSAAWADVDRLHSFLADHDFDVADAIFDRLANSPSDLLDFPRRGSRLSEFDPREVREFRVGHYLLRYELRRSEIFVLRFFHARESVLLALRGSSFR